MTVKRLQHEVESWIRYQALGSVATSKANLYLITLHLNYIYVIFLCLYSIIAFKLFLLIYVYPNIEASGSTGAGLREDWFPKGTPG